MIGTLGWCGYIVEFGLLALPLLMLARASITRHGATLSPCSGTIGLLLAFNMIDMLPNATLIPFTWLIAGALLGYAEALVTGSACESDEFARGRNCAAAPDDPTDAASQARGERCPGRGHFRGL